MKIIDWSKHVKYEPIDPSIIEEKSVWTEEDEEMLEDIRFNYESNKSGMTEGLIEQYNKWFEKIKSLKPQSKQEWSEEDKGNLLDVKCIIDEIWHSQYVRGEIDRSCEELESLWCWLDDIWQRVEYPQSTWRPSDEQMKQLKSAADIYPDSRLGHGLKSLYQDLKKLREE